MKKYKWILIFLNLVALLVFFNYSIIQKEDLLVKGKLIFLELTSDSNKSMMQGDFMNLKYKMSAGKDLGSFPKRGYVVVQLDTNAVAKWVRLQKDSKPLNQNEYLIEYSSTKWDFHIGAEIYFIQEGQSKKYRDARYGGIKVDNQGNTILIGLYDESRQKIE